MASFKQIKFYLLLLSGIAISIIGLYLFFTSSIATSLFNLSVLSNLPSFHLGSLGQASPTKTTNVTITSGSITGTIHASIADNDQLRQQGLMNVTALGANDGMLFIFTDTPQVRTFWMKNTKIPLDMIFISSQKTVVFVQHAAEPCTTDPCPIYSSQFPTEYVLETNAGWAINHNVQPGATVSF